MRTIRLAILVPLLTAYVAIAKAQVYSTYNWESSPKVNDVTKEETEYPAVIISHMQFSELLIRNGAANSFVTEHKVIHVNTQAGIEKFNKVYIPLRNSSELVSIKVRSIDPSGKITNLRKENLKELNNVEGYGNFKIFAVEGITVGGEIEYLYTVKSTPEMYGREMFQTSVPVRASSFALIFPRSVEYSARSYNGLSEPVFQDYGDKRNSISVAVVNVPAAPEEEYSSQVADRMRLDYKFESNGVLNHPFTWDKLGSQLLENSHDPKGSGKVTKLIKSLNLEQANEEEKIKKLEQFIKTNFTIKDGNNPAYKDIKEVLSTNVGSDAGILKLYLAALAELNINTQLVFTLPRAQGSIDFDFPTPLVLQEPLLYFPAYKKYIAPTVTYLRYGPAPDNIAGNNGLFIIYANQTVRVDFQRCYIQQIDILSHEHNKQGVNATIKIKNGVPEVIAETYWQGYRAALYRGIHRNIQGAQREDFIKNVTLSGIDNLSITKRSTEGEDVNLSSDVDSFFKIKTECQAPAILEIAGNDYLVSIGKVIGKQSELYQEHKRQTNIYVPTIANYFHELVLEIPEGYTCAGQEAAKIHNQVKDENQNVVMEFISDSRIEGNKLIINVHEVYKVLYLKKEKYDDFRAVINSAADFNKLVVVLTPSKAN
ncbi:MAG TPA: DUF3857 domain-containing protein [Chryseolinea sp.]